ncbi:MAG TPA: type I glyceraldehyde-3-phosphate dehydrogenase [Planctomycetota bacterium]|nr:type I glyceraldehyde-3-phosphate dehydrogenase [Planctomycetota bacterium]
MAIKVGINGFGRIGRLVFRVMSERKEYDVVAINDLSDAVSNANLLRYDSVHGRYPGEVKVDGSDLVVAGKKVKVVAEKDPANLPWKALGVELVIESTGIFTKKADCEKHIAAGAKKVILTVPAKDKIDYTVVLGVNDAGLKADAKVVSNASCTTNALAPMAKVLNDTFGIEFGQMTTVHAYTNDQKVADQIHKDLRRARAAAVNMIPTSTGAAKAIGDVIPEIAGKLSGVAVRVPVPDGSLVDLTVLLKKEATVAQVNEAFKKAADGPMKGILEYCTDAIVSSDIIGNRHSCVFDSLLTDVIGGKLVKVFGWYDNEMGYSTRVADVGLKMMKM